MVVFRHPTINRDRLFTPIHDRDLPNHPRNIYGYLGEFYLRTRYLSHGSPLHDLPFRGLKRGREMNERYWYLNTAIKGIILFERYWMLGALLPQHWIFLEMWRGDEVRGEKVDPTKPWAFKYVD